MWLFSSSLKDVDKKSFNHSYTKHYLVNYFLSTKYLEDLFSEEIS